MTDTRGPNIIIPLQMPKAFAVEAQAFFSQVVTVEPYIALRKKISAL
jgi:hypothetical protein